MASVFSGAGVTKAIAQANPARARTASSLGSESLTELHNLDTSYANLADFATPAVVDIMSTSGRETGPEGERMPARGGEGSGFIFRSDGYIITNDHVVGGFDKVMVTLHDGRQLQGKVTRAEDSDIAIVKIDATNLPTLSFADSSKTRVGQMCMAVGAPFSLKNSVTFGHVSALGRETVIPEEMAGAGSQDARLYPDLIQTDAAINMGNSGGPLINIDGQVIGINSAIYSPSGVSAGIGFAIPANQARFIGDMLVRDGKITRSMIGLIPKNLEDYQKTQMHLTGGALVDTINSGSPADIAGIKKGDVITRIGSTPVTSELDLRNAMLVYKPGASVPVTIVRDGKTQTLNVKLIAYTLPKTPQQPQMQSVPGLPKDFQGFPGFPRDFFQDQPGHGFGDDQGQDAQPTPHDHTGHARLGIGVSNVTDELRQQYNIPANVKGALVGEVTPGSVGASLGLHQGDVITSFDGKAVDGAEDLTSALQHTNWGDTKNIKFMHFGPNSQSIEDVTVTFK
jgi:serine protease Do